MHLIEFYSPNDMSLVGGEVKGGRRRGWEGRVKRFPERHVLGRRGEGGEDGGESKMVPRTTCPWYVEK
jgi:hypothetical protein